MNIVLMAEYVIKSGVGVYVDSMCTKLRLANNVFIIANDYIFDKNNDVFVKMNLSKADPMSVMKNVYALRNFFKSHKIDVVEINHRRCAFIMKIYNMIFWYDKMPCCWVLHTQAIPASLPYRMITYTGNKTIAISSEVKEFLINTLHVKENKIELILNGVDQTMLTHLTNEEKTNLKNSLGIDEDKIVICVHGRLDEVKGIDALVKAVELLPQNLKDKLIVVCSGTTEGNYYLKLKQLIEQCGLHNKFVFMGWTTAREIFSISDLMIAPSRREGFLFSAIEAFFMKVPCIRTKTGGYKDMCKYCDNIEIDSAEDIVVKISEFLENPNKYDTLVENAYKFASENCSSDVMAEKTAECFASIIKRKKCLKD